MQHQRGVGNKGGVTEGLLGPKQLVLSAQPLPPGPTSSCRKSVFQALDPVSSAV